MAVPDPGTTPPFPHPDRGGQPAALAIHVPTQVCCTEDGLIALASGTREVTGSPPIFGTSCRPPALRFGGREEPSPSPYHGRQLRHLHVIIQHLVAVLAGQAIDVSVGL